MKKIILAFFSFSLMIVGIIFIVHQAYAVTYPETLTGWAWSDGIGWISFSSSTPSYGVQLNSDGTLTGYAWADNIGWISFTPTVNAPSSACPYDPADGGNCAARINLSTGAVNGWARAIIGCGSDLWNGTNCTATTSGIVNGTVGGVSSGWDGWIHLSGSNHSTGDYSGNSGVTFSTSTGRLFGYAWGSDVIGWINFNGYGGTLSTTTTTTSPCNATLQVCAPAGSPAPTATLSVLPTMIYSTTTSSVAPTADITWSSSNTLSCSNVTYSPSQPSPYGINGQTWTVGSTSSNASTNTVGPFNSPTVVTYSILCTGPGGTASASAVLTINTQPINQTPMCSPIQNASLCAYEGTSTTGVNASKVISSSSACTATQSVPQPTYCEYYCNTGFTKSGSKQCLLPGTIKEQ